MYNVNIFTVVQSSLVKKEAKKRKTKVHQEEQHDPRLPDPASAEVHELIDGQRGEASTAAKISNWAFAEAILGAAMWLEGR